MAKNYKRAYDKLKADHEALQRKTFQFGLSLEQEKSGHRKALYDLMSAERNLTRAIATINCAAEVAAGTATGAVFRMIADDLRPRDTCAQGIAPKDEQI